MLERIDNNMISLIEITDIREILNFLSETDSHKFLTDDEIDQINSQTNGTDMIYEFYSILKKKKNTLNYRMFDRLFESNASNEG